MAEEVKRTAEEMVKIAINLADDIDDKIIQAFGQYKPIMAGYHYGPIVTIEKILGYKIDLPGVNRLRAFMCETRKSEEYKDTYKK